MGLFSREEGQVDIESDEALRGRDEAQERASGFDARRLGFRALLGWHYCVLFAPLIDVNGVSAGLTRGLVGRQLVMYIALTCVFAAVLLVIRATGRGYAFLVKPPVTVTGCIVGAAATVASYFLFAQGTALYMAVIAVLGAAEALLIAIWLVMFAVLARKQSYRTLGVDVITGAGVAILVQCLVSPADVFVAASLPLLSAVSFLSLKDKFGKNLSEASETHRDAGGPVSPHAAADKGDAASAHARDDGAAASEKGGGDSCASAKVSHTVGSYLLRRSIPAALFALAFGVLQGSFLADGTAFLIAFNPVLFIGVAIAGVIVLLTRERFCTHADMDKMYRFSLLFFMMGIIVLICMISMHDGQDSCLRVGMLVFAGVFVFAGFNLFDFGNMVLCLGVVRSYGGAYAYSLVLGRVVVYAFMAVGICAGNVMVQLAQGVSHVDVLIIVCCAALVILSFTVVISAMRPEGYLGSLAGAGAKEGVLAADGVPASASASELVRENPCECCNSAPGCSMRSYMEKMGQQAAFASAPGQTLVGVSASPPPSPSPSETAPDGAPEGQEARPSRRTSPAQPLSDGPSGGRKRQPWREAVNEVARRYGLSKRETQIFKLIVKGRNADYVSQELVISIHTAKTHIANIYQKLDVHSSQEMLDLVDAFRAEFEAAAAEEDRS